MLLEDNISELVVCPSVDVFGTLIEAIVEISDTFGSVSSWDSGGEVGLFVWVSVGFSEDSGISEI